MRGSAHRLHASGRTFATPIAILSGIFSFRGLTTAPSAASRFASHCFLSLPVKAVAPRAVTSWKMVSKSTRTRLRSSAMARGARGACGAVADDANITARASPDCR